jgi:hypothetical protein
LRNIKIRFVRLCAQVLFLTGAAVLFALTVLVTAAAVLLTAAGLLALVCGLAAMFGALIALSSPISPPALILGGLGCLAGTGMLLCLTFLYCPRFIRLLGRYRETRIYSAD